MNSTTSHDSPKMAVDRALTIAQRDAERAYGDLTDYRIELSLEPDGWKIDYLLKRKGWVGGGPHYLIDAYSGDIISKRYEQ